ncbi:ABC transporter ATP-binding protein [Candidatus Hydrogenedentota bacterium]
MIRVEDVTKVYTMGKIEVNALRGVSFSVSDGEFISIMGPSGSGKTTLMDILGCLSKPTAGNYKFKGEEVSRLKDSDLARIRNNEIGFVFQTFNLLPRTTARENVGLPLIYSNVTRKERRSRAEEALEAVGLGNRMTHKSNELSGGQRQRVAIARALVNRPSLIFADEPTGNLDSVSGKEIMSIFRGLHEEGHSIIMVTHEFEIAQEADRVLHLQDGLLVSDESVEH